MKCFKCGKEIEGLKTFLPLDRPYVNLPHHRTCYEEIEDELTYITENYDRVLEYVIYIKDRKYTKSNKK